MVSRLRFLLALLPALFALSAITPVFAQTTPTIILTWQAHSYVPADYPGKILPSRETPVDVYLEFTDDNNIVPLDKTLVRWEINGTFLAAGPNLNHISFLLDRFTIRSYAVTATVKNYNGQDIKKTVFIKRVDPFVALQAAPFQKDAAGTRVSFIATPFFFSSSNPSDYIFSWLVNGINGASRLANLNVLIPGASGEQPFSVEVNATNRNNEVESADAKKQFIISN